MHPWQICGRYLHSLTGIQRIPVKYERKFNIYMFSVRKIQSALSVLERVYGRIRWLHWIWDVVLGFGWDRDLKTREVAKARPACFEWCFFHYLILSQSFAAMASIFAGYLFERTVCCTAGENLHTCESHGLCHAVYFSLKIFAVNKTSLFMLFLHFQWE